MLTGRERRLCLARYMETEEVGIQLFPDQPPMKVWMGPNSKDPQSYYRYERAWAESDFLCERKSFVASRGPAARPESTISLIHETFFYKTLRALADLILDENVTGPEAINRFNQEATRFCEDTRQNKWLPCLADFGLLDWNDETSVYKSLCELITSGVRNDFEELLWPFEIEDLTQHPPSTTPQPVLEFDSRESDETIEPAQAVRSIGRPGGAAVNGQKLAAMRGEESHDVQPPNSRNELSEVPATITPQPPFQAEQSSTFDPEQQQRQVRLALRAAYKQECRRRGIKVTDQMIAIAACPTWTERTAVQKWLQCDSRYAGEPDRLIRSVFVKKPHCK